MNKPNKLTYSPDAVKVYTDIQQMTGKGEDCQSFSLQALRDLVRPIDVKLANEITNLIQTGQYIIGERN